MKPEDAFEFSSPGGIPDITLKGHRISIETVLEQYLQEQKTPAEIVELFPTLTLAEVETTLAYYHQHTEEIDRYLAACAAFVRAQEEQERLHPSPGTLRIQQILADHRAKLAHQRDSYSPDR